MEGVSSHFDHVTGRHVTGQQVLTLGLATEEALLPLDSQICNSQVKTRELIKPYKDGRVLPVADLPSRLQDKTGSTDRQSTITSSCSTTASVRMQRSTIIHQSSMKQCGLLLNDGSMKSGAVQPDPITSVNLS